MLSMPVCILFFNTLWAKMDSNHRSRKTADLQSAPFGHSGICPSLVTISENAFATTLPFQHPNNVGASCRIRTNDPEITNHVLWPTELKRQRSLCAVTVVKRVQMYGFFFNYKTFSTFFLKNMHFYPQKVLKSINHSANDSQKRYSCKSSTHAPNILLFRSYERKISKKTLFAHKKVLNFHWGYIFQWNLVRFIEEAQNWKPRNFIKKPAANFLPTITDIKPSFWRPRHASLAPSFFTQVLL